MGKLKQVKTEIEIVERGGRKIKLCDRVAAVVKTMPPGLALGSVLAAP